MSKRLAPLMGLLALSLIALAKDSDEYPLVAKVLESSSRTISVRNHDITTDCQSSGVGYGVSTSCTSKAGRERRETAIRQIVEMSDGNTYEMECRMGMGRAFALGAAAGGGADTTTGCILQPGTYKARRDKRGFVLRVFDQKNKPHDWKFDILAVRPSSK